MYFGLKSMYFKYVWGHNPWTGWREQCAGKRMQIACALRDSAALQAVVADEEDFLLTVSPDPLFWKGGPLKVARIELQMDKSVETQIKLIGLIEDDDRGMKSDLLLDQSHIFVEKRKLQQVWIECSTSANTPPGEYKGTIRLYTHTLFEDETPAGECEFTLQVKDVLLPEPKDYRFYLDLWQHNANIARKYDVPLWSDEHFALLDGYLHSLAQLGQKAVSCVVSEIPWSGQNSHRDRNPSDLFEYSMVRVERNEAGFEYDFSALDRYIRLAERHGISSEIELFGLLNIWQDPDAGYGAVVEGHPDGIRVRYLDRTTGRYRFVREREELDAYIGALEKHFAANGWIDRVRILADEPNDLQLFRSRLDALRKAAPRFRYKVAINHTEFIREKFEGMRDYVPLLSCIAAEYGRLSELRSSIPGKLLYYVCCHPPQPNTFIGSPSLECRLIPWLAEKLGLDGFLRWNYTVWPDRPLEAISYRSTSWRAGDMNFVYPGRTGKPMLSLRYKWLQRGIRDYELMQVLKETGRAEEVRRIVDGVFYFDDPAALHPDQRKAATELYSLEPSDYDRLLALVP
jgi:hypothetical protein